MTNMTKTNDYLLLKKNKINLILCSNGGVKNNIAGFGIVASCEGKIIMEGKQKLPRIYNQYTSHISEDFGILTAFKLLIYLLSEINKKLQQMK
jgi:hypothetical protein